MKILRYINKIIAGVIIVALFFLTVGVAYSYYLARLSGVETNTTITGKTGSMELEIDGGAQITATDIAPSKDPFITKTFIVKGTNKTNDEMGYKIKLIIDENTFSNGAISYTLAGTNTAGNGTVVPNVITRIGLNQGIRSLGIGKYIGQITSGIHTYELKLYFYETEHDQLEDLGKTFNAHVEIKSDTFALLKDEILAQGGGASTIAAKETPSFAQIATTADTGLYATADEYGTSYYYRGERDLLNNNLLFGGFQWKIIRINGDGSIRLIYNGTEAQFTSLGTMNITEVNTQIGSHSWNSNQNDAKYLGYMYGGANGTASTVRDGTTSAAATHNETSSNAKIQLETWYQTNILGKPFENNIVDNLFCNDRQLESEVGGSATGPGYGNTGVYTYYAAWYRLITTKNPTLKCGLKNDRFTTSNDITIGNGALTYPIGLITGDEAVMAGSLYGVDNFTNYLYTDRMWWVMSPLIMHQTGYADGLRVDTKGYIYALNLINQTGLRPVINLASDIKVTGDGSAITPFKVV